MADQGGVDRERNRHKHDLQKIHTGQLHVYLLQRETGMCVLAVGCSKGRTQVVALLTAASNMLIWCCPNSTDCVEAARYL